MKNFLLSMIGMSLFLTASPTFGQVRFGVKGGGSLSTINGGAPLENNPQAIPSFLIGGVAEFKLNEYANLGVGVELQGKGYQSEFTSGDILYTETVRPLFLQVPVQFIMHGNGIFGGIGPYFGYAVGGRTKLESSLGEVNEDIRIGNAETDQITPFEMGLNVEFGYQSPNGYRVTMLYSPGLTDQRPMDQRDQYLVPKFTYVVASLCLTYMFGAEDSAEK